MSAVPAVVGPQSAAQELLRRRRIRSSMVEWARFNKLEPAAHQRLLCEKLEALSRGDIRRLCIFMPPGSAKSTFASVLFPPWYLVNHPDARILACAHTTELAKRWGRRVRNLIAENERLLGITLSEEQAADRWRLESDGEYKAAGVGTGIAGFRADCVSGDTLVICLSGQQRRVDNLLVGDHILSYGGSQRPEYRRVLAIAGRKADAIWRVRTVDGCLVEATGEHPFYTTRGWQPAASLRMGDVLLRALPTNGANAISRNCKNQPTATARRVLQQSMFNLFRECQARHFGSHMHRLWQATVVKANRWSRPFRLLKAMPIYQRKTRMVRFSSSQIQELRNVWQAIYSTYTHLSQSLLLQPLSCCMASNANGGFAQFQLATRQGDTPVQQWQWSPFQNREDISDEKRSALLRYLRRNEAAIGGTSYRWRQYKQQIDQHSNSLSVLSHETPWRRTYETTKDEVVMVEAVCGEKVVYDIQVEKTKCFFANGILVHNCIILDDVIKSREEADSKLIRDRQWDWYKSDAIPRAKPDARWAVINTRWHEDDLSGRLLEEMAHGGDHWEVLSLPAEAEANDPLDRPVGTMLWGDDDYGYARLLVEQKATQTARNWSALYQQRPSPETGDYFKTEWLRPYDKAPARDTLNVYGASDYATKKDGGDYTCHLVVGVDPQGRIFLLDLWRAQSTPDKWIEAFCDLVRQWKPLDWAEESGQIKASVGPFLDMMQRERKAYVNREAFPTKGDKAQRAQAIRGRMALDGLYVPQHAPWYADFRSELLTFPAGKYDDQVDALGLIGQLLDKMVEGRPQIAPSVMRRDDYGEATPKADFSVLTL